MGSAGNFSSSCCFFLISAYNRFIISIVSFSRQIHILFLSSSSSPLSLPLPCLRVKDHNSTVTDFQGTFISPIPCYVMFCCNSYTHDHRWMIEQLFMCWFHLALQNHHNPLTLSVLIFSLIVSDVSSPSPWRVCDFTFFFQRREYYLFFLCVWCLFVVYHELSDFPIICLVRDFGFPPGKLCCSWVWFSILFACLLPSCSVVAAG